MAIANKKQKLVRAAVVAGLVTALGVGQLAANASPYTHPSVVTTAPGWTPHLYQPTGAARPAAYTVAEAGGQMVVGGRFQQVESPNRQIQYNRSNLFSFDTATGQVSDFAPQIDGDVWGLLSDGAWVYVGGSFKNVNGVSRPALAKINLATGQLDPQFQPTFTGARVSDIAMANGQLIVSGTFKKRLVSLNPTTGKPTTYLNHAITGKLANSDAAQVFHFDVSPNEQRLVAVGNFTTVDGFARPRVFMLDLGDDLDVAVELELRAARPELLLGAGERPGVRARRRLLAGQHLLRVRGLRVHVPDRLSRA